MGNIGIKCYALHLLTSSAIGMKQFKVDVFVAHLASSKRVYFIGVKVETLEDIFRPAKFSKGPHFRNASNQK